MKLFKWSRLVDLILLNLFFFFFFFFANDNVSTPDFYIRLCCIIRNIYISCCISMSTWLRKKLSSFYLIISIIYLAYQSNYKTNFHIFSIFHFLSPIFLYYCFSSKHILFGLLQLLFIQSTIFSALLRSFITYGYVAVSIINRKYFS